MVGTKSGGISAGLRYGTFSSKSSLTQHFAKHGDEFGDMYTNAKEYARGAKYVIKNGTYISEKNAYIRFWGTQGKLCLCWHEGWRKNFNISCQKC